MNRKSDVVNTQKPADGLGAVTSTLYQLATKPGLMRGTRALLKANQTDGFDCPSCAWPEPLRRSHFEFCENGAKAIADATTTKRVDAKFFRRHSIVILIIGQNPGTNHPRMLTELERAAHRGCQIITINPLKEAALTRFIHPQQAHRWASRGTQIASLRGNLFSRSKCVDCHRSSGRQK